MANERTKYNVNEFTTLLIRERKFRNEQYSLFVSNCYCFDNIYGTLLSDKLNQYLKAAKRKKKLRIMLADLLLYIDHQSLSHENFNLIINLPQGIRTTCLSSLGHAELSFYQMKELNRFPLALEAFSWLFDHICQFDFFTEEDMLQILRENPDINAFVVQECVNIALAKYGPSKKTSVAMNWITSNN